MLILHMDSQGPTQEASQKFILSIQHVFSLRYMKQPKCRILLRVNNTFQNLWMLLYHYDNKYN